MTQRLSLKEPAGRKWGAETLPLRPSVSPSPSWFRYMRRGPARLRDPRPGAPDGQADAMAAPGRGLAFLRQRRLHGAPRGFSFRPRCLGTEAGKHYLIPVQSAKTHRLRTSARDRRLEEGQGRGTWRKGWGARRGGEATVLNTWATCGRRPRSAPPRLAEAGPPRRPGGLGEEPGARHSESRREPQRWQRGPRACPFHDEWCQTGSGRGRQGFRARTTRTMTFLPSSLPISRCRGPQV